ncbi:hypothetical protein GE09DRAFT_13926 [Coniochaeta sp. 2T2.1]|nr:hypothetical protein GE09DRAFT_13926 [Coniochaeta sp. 2T2.1]
MPYPTPINFAFLALVARADGVRRRQAIRALCFWTLSQELSAPIVNCRQGLEEGARLPCPITERVRLAKVPRWLYRLFLSQRSAVRICSLLNSSTSGFLYGAGDTSSAARVMEGDRTGVIDPQRRQSPPRFACDCRKRHHSSAQSGATKRTVVQCMENSAKILRWHRICKQQQNIDAMLLGLGRLLSLLGLAPISGPLTWSSSRAATAQVTGVLRSTHLVLSMSSYRDLHRIFRIHVTVTISSSLDDQPRPK